MVGAQTSSQISKDLLAGRVRRLRVGLHVEGLLLLLLLLLLLELLLLLLLLLLELLLFLPFSFRSCSVHVLCVVVTRDRHVLGATMVFPVVIVLVTFIIVIFSLLLFQCIALRLNQIIIFCPSPLH